MIKVNFDLLIAKYPYITVMKDGVEKEVKLSKDLIFKLCGMSSETEYRFSSGQNVLLRNVGRICDVVGCQPSDFLKYEKDICEEN